MEVQLGKHIAKAVYWFWDTSKNGNQYLTLAFNVPTHDPEHGDGETLVYGRLNFTEATWQRSVVALKAMGWEGDDLETIGATENECWGGLEKNDVHITVEMGQPREDGSRYPEVKWIDPVNKRWTAKNAPDQSAMSAFSTQMKQRMAMAGQATKTAPSTQSTASAPRPQQGASPTVNRTQAAPQQRQPPAQRQATSPMARNSQPQASAVEPPPF